MDPGYALVCPEATNVSIRITYSGADRGGLLLLRPQTCPAKGHATPVKALPMSEWQDSCEGHEGVVSFALATRRLSLRVPTRLYPLPEHCLMYEKPEVTRFGSFRELTRGGVRIGNFDVAAALFYAISQWGGGGGGSIS